MSRKRQIKRLMALGIQRNDAAGFVKASRILTDKGMHHLLPAPLCDPLPIIVSEREIRTFEACFTCEWHKMLTMTDTEKKAYITRRLGEAIGAGLLRNDLCKVNTCTMHGYESQTVTYRARIDVAVPREVLK